MLRSDDASDYLPQRKEPKPSAGSLFFNSYRVSTSNIPYAMCTTGKFPLYTDTIKFQIEISKISALLVLVESELPLSKATTGREFIALV